MNAAIKPVILSGGSGTRLWPVSREARPKQFHALTGAETMLQMTARRVADPAVFKAPIVVANSRHRCEVAAQLAAIGSTPAAIILEPAGRNTAAAIALAALESDPEELLLVMPSDHVIGDTGAFMAAVETAAEAAGAGWLVTFGIHAHRPETGYGYIQRGERVAAGVYRVSNFIEKPDFDIATGFLRHGGFHWNGGIFLMAAGRYIETLRTHAPDILAAVEKSLAAAERGNREIRPDPELFAAVRSQSVDYAVLERDDHVAVVPVEMGWSDVGSWDALHEVGFGNAQGNVTVGDVSSLRTRNCLLFSEGPKLVTADIDNLIIIVTADAVLVMPRGGSQSTKEVVAALREEGDPRVES